LRVTIEDVAREAGVSIVTISRCTSGRTGSMSDATRARLQADVKRLGRRAAEQPCWAIERGERIDAAETRPEPRLVVRGSTARWRPEQDSVNTFR
jgi:DNA-binding LacI/PurR family transcriptional regulator